MNDSKKSVISVKEDSKGHLVIVVSGDWTVKDGGSSLDSIRSELDAHAPIQELSFDTAEMAEWDTLFLTFLTDLLSYGKEKQFNVNLEGLPDGLQKLLKLALAVPEPKGARRSETKDPFLIRVGVASIAMWKAVVDSISFIGILTLAFMKFITGRARYRRSDFVSTIQECGVQALPIVTLISILAGLILAFVGIMQLAMFGAEIFVAGLVGIGMVRVMGAIFTGIIMAGRTGASFAAQLGTMQVNEEIDALKTMGVSPIEFLVLPRILALALMMPLLCIYADLMGIIGGIIVAVGMMGINLTEYMHMSNDFIRLQDFWIGLVTAFVFGIIIAWAGCYKGLNCGRSAASVGIATTSAVVVSIVGIVVSTAIITIICSILGI